MKHQINPGESMKERPILFIAPMVRALLDGSKTQTRRIVRPQPGTGVIPYNTSAGGWNWVLAQTRHGTVDPFCCTYGRPGDRLFVREAFRLLDSFDCDSPSRVGERCVDAGYAKPWAPIHYEANGDRSNWMQVGTPSYPPTPPCAGRLRSSIHMPRWASRITLEITGVRVERLQDISEPDAIAEGVERSEDMSHGSLEAMDVWPTGAERSAFNAINQPVHQYRRLWEQFNGPGSWGANPWVWVIEFRGI